MIILAYALGFFAGSIVLFLVVSALAATMRSSQISRDEEWQIRYYVLEEEMSGDERAVDDNPFAEYVDELEDT